ncbi:UNVERIFIED_CONTAM: hypothetical protein GTU68_006755 [Idotea baltica]|nr:hypothetical protein [Idotea baltica]
MNSVGFPAIWSSLKHMKSYMDMPKALKASFKMNQKGGFDCPGCAWPDPDDERSSIGEYCENGIKALAEEATKKKCDPDFFASHSIDQLAKFTDYELGKSGRLTHPMYLSEGATHYHPITWDDAFKLIGNQLNSLPSPNRAAFYTSGRTSNEAAFLYQLMVRGYGTNNLPDCSNMCHESSGVGLSETVGIGKGSVTLEDIHNADVLIIMGQNPGTNHPRMLSAIERCKERGGKIVTVNPLPEAGLIKYTNPQRLSKMITGGLSLTDLYLPIRINGDVAFLKALMLLLHEKEKEQVIDKDFIHKYTEGYNEYLKDLQRYKLTDCIDKCGLEEDALRTLANWMAPTQKIIVCWAMGLTQHENGVDNIREIVNLLLLKGAIGIPGGGTCPVRGHSNVQGDRTMGIWEAPKDDFLDQLSQVFNFNPPRQHGLAVVPTIEAMHASHVDTFIAMGGNFLSASPDTDYTAEALKKCALTVQISTKLNRSHLISGREALILPCLGRTDIDIQASGYQFVSVENSMGIVHSSKGVLMPISEHLKSEPAIIAGIANEIKFDKLSINWDHLISNYDHIRDHISATISGFDDYNTRVRQKGGFYLPNGARERKFNTSSGKAQFTINEMPSHELSQGQFHLMTIRSHDQFNTTIYGMDDRYRGIYNGRRVIMMNSSDMKELGLQSKDKINVHSDHAGRRRSIYQFTVVPYQIPRRCLAAYFPEVNPLVPITSFARGSQTPASKLVVVTLSMSD